MRQYPALVLAAFLISAYGLRGAPGAGSSLVQPGEGDKLWAQIQSQMVSDSNSVANVPYHLEGTGPDAKIVRRRGKTSDEIETDHRHRATVQYQVAQLARSFYRSFPQHPEAAHARKLEAEAALKSISDDDKSRKPQALRIAKAYCDDNTNPSEDRFDVACLLAEAQQRGNVPRAKDAAVLERVANELQAKFSDEPKAYLYYVSVARTADMDTAKRMADRLLGWPTTPASARREAEGILARHAMLGKPIDLELHTTTGKSVRLGKSVGSPIILYVWSSVPQDNVWTGLGDPSLKMPEEAGTIFLNISGSGEEQKEVEAQFPTAAAHCLEETGGALPSRAALHVTRTPYVYVFDATANLKAFGPAELLPSLIANSK